MEPDVVRPTPSCCFTTFCSDWKGHSSFSFCRARTSPFFTPVKRHVLWYLVSADSAKQASFREVEIEHATAALDAVNSGFDVADQLPDASQPVTRYLPHGLTNQFVRERVRQCPSRRGLRFV